MGCLLCKIKMKLNRKRIYSASFTAEAAMVCGIVFLTLAGLIQYAYTLHDTVTGKMILTEVLDEVRYCKDEALETDEFEEKGNTLGNPRLWLGEYRIKIREHGTGLSGIAAAGDWETQIDLKKSYPSEFLRGIAAVEELERVINGDGSRVQAGDESELYGSQPGVGANR